MHLSNVQPILRIGVPPQTDSHRQNEHTFIPKDGEKTPCLLGRDGAYAKRGGIPS